MIRRAELLPPGAPSAELGAPDEGGGRRGHWRANIGRGSGFGSEIEMKAQGVLELRHQR